MSLIRIIRLPLAREELKNIAKEVFGDMVKGVVDIDQKIMAIGGEMHADEERALLDQGSLQSSLWGINLYPELFSNDFVEFDSMINIRPSQGNRSRSIEDASIQNQIREIVTMLIQ